MGNINDIEMPFTGHSANKLLDVLDSINNSSLKVELFDAFLAEYVKTSCLDNSLNWALLEWDC